MGTVIARQPTFVFFAAPSERVVGIGPGAIVCTGGGRRQNDLCLGAALEIRVCRAGSYSKVVIQHYIKNQFNCTTLSYDVGLFLNLC